MADLGAIGSNGTVGSTVIGTPSGSVDSVAGTISGMTLITGTSFQASVTVDSPYTAPAYMRILAEGFQKDRASAVSRTAAEDGMVKQLKRQSRVLVSRRVTIQLDSRTDYQNFIGWYRITLEHGARWFNWTDPEDGQVKLARFVEKLESEIPVFGAGVWRISATIETWDNG